MAGLVPAVHVLCAFKKTTGLEIEVTGDTTASPAREA